MRLNSVLWALGVKKIINNIFTVSFIYLFLRRCIILIQVLMLILPITHILIIYYHSFDFSIYSLFSKWKQKIYTWYIWDHSKSLFRFFSDSSDNWIFLSMIVCISSLFLDHWSYLHCFISCTVCYVWNLLCHSCVIKFLLNLISYSWNHPDTFINSLWAYRQKLFNYWILN